MEFNMPDNNGNCGCGCGCSNGDNSHRDCCNGGLFNGLFGGNRCCCGDSQILFFIIIFLLLFTNFGCCNN